QSMGRGGGGAGGMPNLGGMDIGAMMRSMGMGGGAGGGGMPNLGGMDMSALQKMMGSMGGMGGMMGGAGRGGRR
ncbi:hypothetical protein KCU75_g22037, partial [Aureobasidium melanogenum]